MKIFNSCRAWASVLCLFCCVNSLAQHTPVLRTTVKPVVNSTAPFNGILQGSFSINANGAVNYTIQPDIPPGTDGFQPLLQLAYSSQSNNGLMGMGFSLSGLSSITRTGATVPQDGFRGGVNYDGNDRFALDGNRLLAANTGGRRSYFSPGASYYTEMQYWSKIVANDTSGQGPATFTVYQKDGSIAQYGNGNGSQVRAQGPEFNKGNRQGSVRIWRISSLANTNGNIIRFFYTRSPKNLQGIPMTGSAGDGTAYPDAIYYTSKNGVAGANRKIQFLYEPRTDTLLQYAGGAASRMSARLKAIQTFIIAGADTTQVNSYILSYDDSAPLQVSRLSSIIKLGNKGGSTQPVTFQWTNGANGLTGTRINWTGPASNAGFEGDFNGDGKTDLVPVSNNVISNIYYAGDNGFTRQALSPTILVTPTSYVADYNVDGFPDLLVLRGSGMGRLYYGNGHGLDNPVGLSGLQYNSGGAGIWVADFNGDGRADLFSVIGTAGYIHLANGKGFNKVQPVPGLSLQIRQTFVADFNADGQTDVFSGDNTGGHLYLSDFSHTGAFQPVIGTRGLTISDAPQNNLVADFNSDGLADILTHINNQYNLYYSNGHDFADPVPIRNVNLNITQNWLSDFNGDGTMDFYALSGTTTTIYYYYAGKFQSRAKTSPAFISGATWTGDFNGDGIADLFAANTSTIYYGGSTASSSLPAVNQVPNLVTVIDNGINSRDSITYKPITDAIVYEAEPAPGDLIQGLHIQNRYNSIALAPLQVTPYPFVYTQSALYVAHQYTANDGLGNRYSYRYKYAGSLLDVQAYGWLGFRRVITTDSTGQNIFTNEYLQRFPLTGRVHTSIKTDLRGKRLSRQRNDYRAAADTLNPFQSKTYQVLNTAARNDYFDEDVFAYTTGINYGYDRYTNPIAQAQLNDTSGTNNIVYTRNQYINDTIGWHIGYLQSSLQSSDSAGKILLRQTTYRYDTVTYQVIAQSSWLNTDNTSLTSYYAYDAYGNRVQAVDEAGDTTLVAYDTVYHSFPVSQTSPPNQWNVKLVNKMVYDPAFGKMVSATDANGNDFRIISDQFGRDSLMMGPDSSGQPVMLSQVFYYRDSTGYTEQTIIRNDWAGNRQDTSEAAYDGLERTYRQTWRGQDGRLVTQLQSFNSNNQVIWQSLPFFDRQQPQGIVTRYDPDQRIASVTLPGSRGLITNRYGYRGKQVIVHNAVNTPDSATSYCSFDYFNGVRRSVQRIDETGLVTRFGYDGLGRQTSITDPAKLVTALTYNSLGDIIATNTPGSGRQTVLYNYTGNSSAVIGNAGDTVTSFYDALDRKLSVKTPSGATLYQYDLAGFKNGRSNLCRVIMEDTGIYYAYQYDAYHQPVTALLHIAGKDYAQAFSYNPDQSTSSITYPDHSVAHYTYYNNGYLQQVSMSDAAGNNINEPYVTYARYDAEGNQQVVTYGNGVQRTAAFNPFGTVDHYQIHVPGSQPVASKYYRWNGVNNITAIIDSLNANNSEYFSYKANGRLDTAQSIYGRLAYGYDDAGNITAKDSVALHYDKYRVTAGYRNGVKLFTNRYDGNGNLAQHTAWQGQDSVQTLYHFNALNQLTSIVQGADTSFTFTYDIDGNRLVKKDCGTGITTYYISPQYEVVVTKDSVFNTRYVNAPANLVASVTHSAALSGGVSPGAVTAYLHQDFVNSTTYVTDTSGHAAGRVIYKPFGDLYSIQGDTAQYLFGSKQLDESGLYYFSSRYYDPVTARFITADNTPGGGAMQADAFNAYAYTLNNPVKYYDPSGHTILGDIFIQVLLTVLDVVTEGAAIPEQALLSAEELEAAVGIAEEETGADFARALQQSRTSGAIDNEQAVRIYQAKRDTRAGLTIEQRTNIGNGIARKPVADPINDDYVTGYDNYGNEIFPNTDADKLSAELKFRDDKLSQNNAQRTGDPKEIGRLISTGQDFKFTVSFEDYSLNIGSYTLSHAAIEGEGRYIYSAGYVRKEGENLILVNRTGHYMANDRSLRLSIPLWQMLKDRGYLQFKSILYKPF